MTARLLTAALSATLVGLTPNVSFADSARSQPAARNAGAVLPAGGESSAANCGRKNDLVADHPCGTYIFELKVDRSPAIAMSQAERKDYAAPFAASQKPIWFVGLSFERETRKFLAGVTAHLWRKNRVRCRQGIAFRA